MKKKKIPDWFKPKGMMPMDKTKDKARAVGGKKISLCGK